MTWIISASGTKAAAKAYLSRPLALAEIVPSSGIESIIARNASRTPANAFASADASSP